MKTIREASIATLVVVLLGACSQGADSDPFGWPPGGPTPSTMTDGGQATFGVDTEGSVMGGCCLPLDEPGCGDELVESCVCMQRPSCCTSQWSSECAAAVDELGCGFCVGEPPDTSMGDPDDTGAPPPGEEGDCCATGSAPGCNDDTVEACVCGEIPFCCESGWEEVCASAVEALGCGHCAGTADTGDTGDPPPGDSGEVPPETTGEAPVGGCCDINMTPGCDDATVQDCVCMQDAYCCDTAWDDVCVGEVDSFGCGDCGTMPPPETSTCCSAQASAGCDDQAIADCVCFIDDYCCTTQWDAACAVFVELFACGSCS